MVRITNALLLRAAQRDKAEPEDYFKRYGEHKVTEKGDGLQFEFGSKVGVNRPHLFIDLTWNEISEIIDTISRSGRAHKDERSGLTFLE